MDVAEEVEPVVDENELIKGEAHCWQKNASFLYNLVLKHQLVWPSLTIEWLPGMNIDRDLREKKQRLLLGTHTSNQDTEKLYVLEATLPAGRGEKERIVVPQVEVLKSFTHACEVTRVRHMPQDCRFVATRSLGGRVDIYNLDSEKDCVLKTLTGHKEDGYGLSWCPVEKERIASCGEDKKLLVYEIEKSTTPVGQFNDFENTVEDVVWNPESPHLLFTTCDDKHVRMHDIRSNKLEWSHKCHEKEVYSIDFNKKYPWLFATGGGDRLVKLWDMRRMPEKNSELGAMPGHKDEIFTVWWSPHHGELLASSGADRRVIVWDVSKIGTEQDQEKAKDGPPELLFKHAGHTSRVNEFSWSFDKGKEEFEFLFASVSDSNELQIWEMLDQIYYTPEESKIHNSEIE